MTRFRNHAMTFVAGCATALLVGATIAAVQPQDPADMEAAWMAAVEKYGTPGEEHKEMMKWEGEWTAHCKFWMAPGAPEQESTGQSTFESILNDRYMIQHFTNNMDGMEMHGVGLLGYDRMSEKYFNIWIDDMSTGLSYSMGTKEDGAITYEGKMPDVMAGKYIETTMVERRVSDDEMIFEMHSPGPTGEQFKSMEIRYVRN